MAEQVEFLDETQLDQTQADDVQAWNAQYGEEEEEDVSNDCQPCCPICSLVWTSSHCALQKEIHVNACLEKFELTPIGTRPASSSASSSSREFRLERTPKHMKTFCPVCNESFEDIRQAEVHTNECLDKAEKREETAAHKEDSSHLPLLDTTNMILPSMVNATTAKDMKNCPVCFEHLSGSLPRKIRHIKSCASESHIVGPRDLKDGGMLDLVLEEMDRLDAEGYKQQENLMNQSSIESLTPSSSSIDAATKRAPKITEFFSSLKPSTSSRAIKQPITPCPSSKPWRSCPYWKKIPDTKIVVDAFEYANPELSTKYILSHFHYDHYIGLTRHFNAGTIYCGPTTARLTISQLKVPKQRVKIINLGERTDLGNGCFVTAFDANHAPGSCVFIFETSTKKLYLHTGDFRASDDLAHRVKLFASLRLRPIDTIFLDTTYCSKEYDFLPQDKVINQCKQMVESHLKDHSRVLVVFGSYTIGKERLALACLPSEKKLAVSKQKMQILRCYDEFDVADLARFTTERTLSSYWMVGMNELDVRKLTQLRAKHLNRFDSILAVRATGWVKHFKKVKENDHVHTLFVPYSEHSSFGELKRFVRHINPRQVVPTVMSKGVTKEEMLSLLMY